MEAIEARMQEFVAYVATLRGDEKGEAQLFCDQLFKAFGHAGVKQAGATLEERVSMGRSASGRKSTKFADLVWKPRLLLEMKKRGEKLQNHYQQAFDYWVNLVPDRPRYVVLCNFDEFWIYDFDTQVEEPVDRVRLEELPKRYTALNFLLPLPRTPLFKNNRVDVTRDAANKVVLVFNALIETQAKHRVPRDVAQRFILQCVVAMFSEDMGLLPTGLFTQLVKDARVDRDAAYDLFTGLFRQMNTPQAARGGRFENVRYFNGGLFSTSDVPVLALDHLLNLEAAAQHDWSRVQPAIFGTLFENSVGQKQRHALGAHFTSETDIQAVVRPSVLRPWEEKLVEAQTFEQFLSLHRELLKFKVLDPACGSGNFLYVAYRELKRLETQLLERLVLCDADAARVALTKTPLLSTQQFFGIDTNPFAVELAKVTLMLAKELAVSELQSLLQSGKLPLPVDVDRALPLDNLDDNIRCDDALFCAWPAAHAIIGNPPYQSKNKMQAELGRAAVNRVRERYPGVPGRADYCVYWFRRAHDELPPGGRAGLVGTNTIRQNYSREGGLDYIVAKGGTIVEAIGSQVWSGDAAVHVSIVNWIKGVESGPKVLRIQNGDRADSKWLQWELPSINAALSPEFDVTAAVRLRANIGSGACYQGQTHGHEGFLLSPPEAAALRQANARSAEVLFPYLIADDLLGRPDSRPARYVIDFHPRDVFAAGSYKAAFKQVRDKVLPAREAAAAEEFRRNLEVLAENPKAKVNNHHRNFLNKWWLLAYPRNDLIQKLNALPRYIACGQVTKRPIFEFIDSAIRPNAAIVVFPLADDYSFGILQSGLHALWFRVRCSTLEERPRYTSDSVFDTFVWPQHPTTPQVAAIAAAGRELRELRREVMTQNGWSLRELYRTLDVPGHNPLRSAQQHLDEAVNAAYGLPADDDALAFLLALNGAAAACEIAGQPVTPPGLPPALADAALISDDCVRMPVA